MLSLSREDVEARAKEGFRVPLFAEILADLETPVSAYWKLAHDATQSFLLESVTGGEQLARYSFIGCNPYKVLQLEGGKVSIQTPAGDDEFTIEDGAELLDLLRREMALTRVAHVEGLPRFVGGAVGFLSYDCVRYFETIPDSTGDDLNCEDIFLMFCDTVVAFDHARNKILVISLSSANGYDQAADRINSIIERLAMPLPTMPASMTGTAPRFSSNITQEAYERHVRKTIEYIEAGDGVQMVISQRFSAPVTAHPISIYRSLRSLNPSPYMYLLQLGTCDVIGASPEVLVTCEDETARVRPIAGTRRRGKTDREDKRLEQELLADEKERAEHLMLVDLGRNDLGQIAAPGGVVVREFMTIEKYSHVMHIVSDVIAKLREEVDCFDVFRACFPAGTVTGAPKIRAMEIIDELEPCRRGLYAGAVGYFGFNGDMDMAIAIRTIYLKNGVAYVQAGAGIVYDSVPSNEWQECHNKAEAVLLALEQAERGVM